MFIKIMRYLDDEEVVSDNHGNAGNRCIPKGNYIFEAEGVDYRKVAVKCLDEFHEMCKEIESVHVVTPISREGGKLQKDKPFEFLMVKLMEKIDGDWMVSETLIASDCTLFVMNRSGKTIERLVCLGHFNCQFN